MDKIVAARKSIMIVGVVAVIIVLVLMSVATLLHNTNSTPQIVGQASSTNMQTSTLSTDTTTTAATPPDTTSTPPSKTPPVVIKPLPPIIITIITPAAGAAWKIGDSNLISWDNAGTITGEIDLIDAKTGTLAGVITSNTGPHQTSYSWDTRELFLARYNALKRDVVPGTYIVRLKFDGNNLPDIASGAITIEK